MADSDIQVTALTASQAGPGAINVVPITSGGSCLPYLALAAVEIWGAVTNNRANATNLGDTIVGFLHSGLAANTTRYYWARARDASGNYGDWYPASATAGRSATTSTVAPGPNSIGEAELKDDAVTGPKVKDGAVTQTKIANAAIVNAHLGNAIIATANIQNASVTDAKISSLTADKITAGTLITGITYTGTLTAGQVTAGQFTGLGFDTGGLTTYVRINALTNDIFIRAEGSMIRLGGTTGPVIEAYAFNRVAVLIEGDNMTPEQPCMWVDNNASNGMPLLSTSSGLGTGHAFRGRTRQRADGLDLPAIGGQAIVGVSSGGGGHAVYAEKGGYGPFTGAHDAFVAKDETTEVGDIVCDLKVIARNGVDDTVTEVYVAEDDADPAAVGVVSRRMAFEPGSLMGALPQNEGVTRLRELLAERYDRLAINSVGEGQVNVCGRGGDIAAGDLIMTSTLRGKGQRQPDGIVRNYTVGKARESVTFGGGDGLAGVRTNAPQPTLRDAYGTQSPRTNGEYRP